MVPSSWAMCPSPLRPQPQLQPIRLEVDPLNQQLDDAGLLRPEHLCFRNGSEPLNRRAPSPSPARQLLAYLGD